MRGKINERNINNMCNGKGIKNNSTRAKITKSYRNYIQKNNISSNVVDLILSQYGYKNTNDIKIKDYMNIVNDFKTKVSD